MDDLILATNCAKGDKRSQQALYAAHKHWVMGVCIRYMGFSDADDAFQEVFIKIFEKVGQFKGNSSLKTWLRHLAVNQCIDIIRKNKKFKYAVNIDDYLNDNDVFEEEVEEDEDELTPEIAMELMNSLPERYRLCLNLFAIEKYNYHQIGELLNMNESTCRGNVSKARDLLRQMLNKKKIVHHEKTIAS